MGRRRGAAQPPETSLVPQPESAPVTSEVTSEESAGGWSGWIVRHYATLQILLTLNTVLLWWLGTTEAVGTSLNYIFNSVKGNFS